MKIEINLPTSTSKMIYQEFLSIDENSIIEELSDQDMEKYFHSWDRASISLMLVLCSGYYGTEIRKKSIEILANYFDWVGKIKKNLTAEHAKARKRRLKYIKKYLIEKYDGDALSAYFSVGSFHIF